MGSAGDQRWLQLLLLLLAALLGPAGAAQTGSTRDDIARQIAAEVALMDANLDNLTIALDSTDTLLEQAAHLVVQEGDGGSRPVLRAPDRLALEAEGELQPCDVKSIQATLAGSARVLDKVTQKKLNGDVADELQERNKELEGYAEETTCSLQLKEEDKELLETQVGKVKEHVEPASNTVAAALAENGLAVGSAFMVILIVFCCLIGVGVLVSMAVLLHKHVRGSAPTRPGASGEENPAYRPADPPGSLHQARNERWRRQSDVELSDSPHVPRAVKKSTLGRVWGSVVKDYQRHQPTEGVHRPSRRHERDERPGWREPPSRRDEPPSRRDEPPSRRDEPLSRRDAWPARREEHEPRPSRRAEQTPPPRRASPGGDSGDNWSYGPTGGRSKSKDSPFSGW